MIDRYTNTQTNTQTHEENTNTVPSKFYDNTPTFGNDDDGDEEVIDLSEAEEAEYEPLPPGVYDAEVEDATYQLSQRSNQPMVVWVFTTEVEDKNGTVRRRKLYMNTSLQMEQRGRVKKLVATLDPSFDLRHFRPRTAGEDFAGRACRLRVTTRTYEGRKLNQVKDVLPSTDASRAFLPNR